MDIAKLIMLDKPAQPGTAQITTGRVSEWVAICTHCGITEKRFKTKSEAEYIATGHIELEHPNDAPKNAPMNEELKEMIHGNSNDQHDQA